MRNILAFIFLLILTTSCGASDKVSIKVSEINDERQQYLMHLLLADCGSCHGMTMKGGIGPSLLAKDLQMRTDEQLFNTIKHGSPETPMPPWQPFLSDNEIHWMIQTLRQQSWKK